jgi:uncharacterized protein YbjQ (UPF0145 family)
MNSRYVAALILFAACAAPASARDTPVHLVLADVVDDANASGQLDGSVRFYLDGQHTPAVLDTFGEATSNRKTNAVNKSDAEACRWVALSALIALQQEARARGANAVIGITSQFKRRSFSDAEKFECNAGALMAGVAFRGTYATVADR